MKIKHKINLFIITMLGLLVIPLALAGYAIIDQVVYNLNETSFKRELTNIDVDIREGYKELESTGLLNIESYVLAEKQRILKRLGNYKFGKTGQFYILDFESRVVLHKDFKKKQPFKFKFARKILKKENGKTSYIYKGKKRFAIFLKSSEWDWILVLSITEAEMFSARDFYRKFALVFGIAVFILVLILSWALTKNFRKEIDITLHCLNQIEKGNLDTYIQSVSNDEIGLIQGSINSMIATVAFKTKELKESQVKADAANRAKSEFLANMSHELRTPLNAVTGFCELLSSLVSDKKQKSYLNAIKTAGKSLLTLINDILDLSKIEAGMMEIQLAPVNPQIIFNEIEQIFKMKIIDKNLQFITDIDKYLPSALILDETRLRQILLNLVGNAVKFTEYGHIRLSVKQIYKTGDKSSIDLIISVEDTGIGISEQDQEIIFESFKQQYGHNTRKFGGTGLGLSISKRLAEIMNGQITVRSTVGTGSIFEITLKDVNVSSAEVSAIEERACDIENTCFEKANVLIVDDIESNRDMLSELLSMVNLNVLTAENGQEAVLLAREYKPDIILMDIRMPVMDGIEATKKLKQDPKTKHIPVIAITASSSSDEKSEILAKGLDGYLTKPVKVNILFDELSRYLKCTEKGKQASEHNNQFKTPAYKKIERLPELVGTLRNEILPCLDELQGALIMGDIREFGKRLQNLGKEHNFRELICYSEYLLEFADNFDITGINDTFKDISGTVEQLTDFMRNIS